MSASIIGTLQDNYHYLFTDLADPRVKDWFLMSDPIGITLLIASYLSFVLYLGPRLMKNRKPFELNNVMIVYNFLQILTSIFLFYQAAAHAWFYNYSWRCEPVDHSTTPHAMWVARGVHLFFLAKIFELLDTIFFVLRKKDKQVSFLHVFHHASMAILSWIFTKCLPGGHGTFMGFLNSFVHIIMYFYYMLAAMGPQVRKYLWWKKYITHMQMLQFLILIIHASQIFYYDCGYPKLAGLVFLPYLLLFLYLFNNFYKQAYGGDKKETEGLPKVDVSRSGRPKAE